VVSLQAYVRPGHHTLRYADIGDLQEAKRLGFYIYEWAVAGRNGAPAVRVEARGVDPEYLGSYLIVRQRPNVGASASPTEASEAGVERDP